MVGGFLVNSGEDGLVKGRYHALNGARRKKVLKVLAEALAKEQGLCVAYVYGSFVENDPFHDIDLALYYHPTPEFNLLDRELDLEVTLEEALIEVGFRIPVDVRIINHAPLSFQYGVIKNGEILLVRDDDRRVDFEVLTLSKYFDFAPFRAAYLKEVLGL
jgi:predicted nucleotidyltransferase